MSSIVGLCVECGSPIVGETYKKGARRKYCDECNKARHRAAERKRRCLAYAGLSELKKLKRAEAARKRSAKKTLAAIDRAYERLGVPVKYTFINGKVIESRGRVCVAPKAFKFD